MAVLNGAQEDRQASDEMSSPSRILATPELKAKSDIVPN